jgi:hypothetical protein
MRKKCGGVLIETQQIKTSSHFRMHLSPCFSGRLMTTEAQEGLGRQPYPVSALHKPGTRIIRKGYGKISAEMVEFWTGSHVANRKGSCLKSSDRKMTIWDPDVGDM